RVLIVVVDRSVSLVKVVENDGALDIAWHRESDREVADELVAEAAERDLRPPGDRPGAEIELDGRRVTDVQEGPGRRDRHRGRDGDVQGAVAILRAGGRCKTHGEDCRCRSGNQTQRFPPSTRLHLVTSLFLVDFALLHATLLDASMHSSSNDHVARDITSCRPASTRSCPCLVVHATATAVVALLSSYFSQKGAFANLRCARYALVTIHPARPPPRWLEVVQLSR